MRASTWLFLLLAPLAPGLASGAQPPAFPTLEREIATPAPARRQPAGPSEVDKALAARDYERAERLLAAEIERNPTSTALLRQIATVFLMDRKPLNAAIALKKAEAIAPLDARTRLQLAMAYVAMRRGDWARPELERLAAAEPGNVIYPYWLARLDYDAGQYDSAIDRLKSVVARAPSFVRAHDNLGLCYEALNRADEAVPHYREAVRLNRIDEEARSVWPPLNLGILLRTRGELEEADALFREALGYDPRFAPAHYQRGILLEQSGRIDEAVQALRRAADADRAYAEPHYALSRIYRRQGRVREADDELAAFQRLRDDRERAR
jgi:tetratricopeptide (TPR) repeat protein